MKTLKEKILDKDLVFGTQIMMNNTVISDIFSSVGYDFMWIDTEHCSIGYEKF